MYRYHPIVSNIPNSFIGCLVWRPSVHVHVEHLRCSLHAYLVQHETAHMYMHAHMYTFTQNLHVYAHAHIDMNTRKKSTNSLYVCMFVLMYVCIHGCLYVQTPLHLASSMGFPQCIEVLLANGARMDVKNTHRETAYNLVRGKVKCERVFQHAIARFQIPHRTAEQQSRVEGQFEMDYVSICISHDSHVYVRMCTGYKY